MFPFKKGCQCECSAVIFLLIFTTFSWHFLLWGSSFPWVRVRCVLAPLARLRPPPLARPAGAAPPPGGAVAALRGAR